MVLCQIGLTWRKLGSFGPRYPPHLVHVVIECPLTEKLVKSHGAVSIRGAAFDTSTLTESGTNPQLPSSPNTTKKFCTLFKQIQPSRACVRNLDLRVQSVL